MVLQYSTVPFICLHTKDLKIGKFHERHIGINTNYSRMTEKGFCGYKIPWSRWLCFPCFNFVWRSFGGCIRFALDALFNIFMYSFIQTSYLNISDQPLEPPSKTHECTLHDNKGPAGRYVCKEQVLLCSFVNFLLVINKWINNSMYKQSSDQDREKHLLVQIVLQHLRNLV